MTSARPTVVQGSDDSPDVVIFLPPAGSRMSPYFPLGSFLPATMAAVHCEIPGRGRLDTSMEPSSLDEMVDLWGNELSRFQGRRLHLFGHSLGALLAYELAVHLSQTTTGEVTGLLVSGARPPHELPPKWGDTTLTELRDQRAATSGPEEAADTRWLRHDLRLRQEHQCSKRVITAALTILAGREDGLVPPAEMNSWKKFTSGPFLGRFIFDGGHTYYASRPTLVATTVAHAVELSQSSTRS